MQKVLSSKLLYDGILFTVRQDEVEIKEKPYKRDIVHHKSGGVGVLAIVDEKIVFVKQYRPAVQEEVIEVPAGKLEPNEDPMITGMRELAEECGLKAQRLHKICTMFATPGYCDEQIHLYYAEGVSSLEHKLEMDEDEEIEMIYLSLEEALLAIQNGVIKDAKTIIAVQYAHALSLTNKLSAL